MYRRHGNKLGFVFLACDLLVTAVVWFAAYFVRFTLLPSPDGVPDFHLVCEAVPGVLLLAAISFRLSGLYEIHRLRQLPREVGTVCKASGLLFVLVITLAFYRRDLYESRLALSLFLMLNTVALVLARRCVWRALKYLRSRGLNYGRAIIVGAGRTGQLVARTIRDNSWTGLEPIGFVDEPGKVESAELPRLGRIDDLPSVVEQHQIDHVFVALPSERYGELARVNQITSQLLVEVQLVPDIPNLIGMRLKMMEIDGVAFLNLRENPHQGLGRVTKRALDIAVSTAALVLLSPLLFALAIMVKLSSPGPILFRQRRTGLGGYHFTMLKFRSMPLEAEQGTGPVWATRNDTRCTAIGSFLRRWSLDELPQLLNVLRGDMSLVGPRPERGVFVEKFRNQIPCYHQRHRVKAGITGWAQVNGWRGNTSLRHRVQCDLYYIANWSIWLDLRILAMTVWCGIRHKNAY